MSLQILPQVSNRLTPEVLAATPMLPPTRALHIPDPTMWTTEHTLEITDLSAGTLTTPSSWQLVTKK